MNYIYKVKAYNVDKFGNEFKKIIITVFSETEKEAISKAKVLVDRYKYTIISISEIGEK